MAYKLINKESQINIYKGNIEVYVNSFRPCLHFSNKFRFMLNYDVFPIRNAYEIKPCLEIPHKSRFSFYN